MSQAGHWRVGQSVHTPDGSQMPAVSTAPSWEPRRWGVAARGTLGWPPASPGSPLRQSLAVQSSGPVLELNLGGR